ncbi:hypothetical protein EDD85DRAFT_547989 [Armillaria nabsnona]|nr:hypothetical protein EDD85DRAFT_547989 [Armillaria nabsnona]
MAPESTNLNEDSSNKELPSVSVVLKSFGYAIEPLNGTNVYSLSNIITMQSDDREWFARLEIWFEKTVCITRKPPYPKQSHLHPGSLRNPIHLAPYPQK